MLPAQHLAASFIYLSFSRTPRGIFLCASKLGVVCFYKSKNSNSSLCKKAGRKPPLRTEGVEPTCNGNIYLSPPAHKATAPVAHCTAEEKEMLEVQVELRDQKTLLSREEEWLVYRAMGSEALE